MANTTAAEARAATRHPRSAPLAQTGWPAWRHASRRWAASRQATRTARAPARGRRGCCRGRTTAQLTRRAQRRSSRSRARRRLRRRRRAAAAAAAAPWPAPAAAPPPSAAQCRGQSQRQRYRERTHEGCACAERSKTEGIKQRVRVGRYRMAGRRWNVKGTGLRRARARGRGSWAEQGCGQSRAVGRAGLWAEQGCGQSRVRRAEFQVCRWKPLAAGGSPWLLVPGGTFAFDTIALVETRKRPPHGLIALTAAQGDIDAGPYALLVPTALTYATCKVPLL
eukprot:305727-Chlamydomonas_euryale.AAC.1